MINNSMDVCSLLECIIQYNIRDIEGMGNTTKTSCKFPLQQYNSIGWINPSPKVSLDQM